MTFVDLDTVLVPSSGAVGTSAWGAQVNDNVAALEALVAPPWQLWDAQWATIATVGNGSVVGEVWKQGREVRARATWTMGTTTAWSGAAPAITLPYEAASALAVIGTAFLTDSSAGAVRTGTCVTLAGSTTTFGIAVWGAASPGLATSTLPWTLASGDTVAVDICYRSAS